MTAQPLEYQPTTAKPVRPSKLAFWAGWVLSALPALFMGAGGVAMMFNPKMVQEGMAQNGFANPTQAGWIVLTLEVVFVLIYLIPSTAVLGAILLTAYLGGAVVTHLRLAEMPQTIVPIVLGIFVWLGLYLREPRLRCLAPIRSRARNVA
jgi:hypothetical protein